MGEGGDGLRDDGPGLDRRLQPELQEAETITAGQVPPRLPAEHGGRVEQDDALDLWLRAGVEEQPGTTRSAPTGSASTPAAPAIRSAISASTSSATAANRSALSRNWWYMAPRVTPAARTISSVPTSA